MQEGAGLLTRGMGKKKTFASVEEAEQLSNDQLDKPTLKKSK